MHEATIARSILEIAQQRADKMPDGRVEKVRVHIGTFRNVDPQSLEFAFDALKTEFERCQGAMLEMELIEAEALCVKRRHHYKPVIQNGFRCQLCGSGISELLRGDELNVVGCTVSTKEEPLCTKP